MKRTLILECLETKALLGALTGLTLATALPMRPAVAKPPPPPPEPDPGPLPIDNPPIVLPPLLPWDPSGQGGRRAPSTDRCFAV